MKFSMFLALKYLRPQRGVASVVTLLSVLGVTIGVAIVIIVRAVFTGFGDTWQQKILAFKPHIVIQAANRQPLVGEEGLCRALEQIPGVEATSPSIETRVLAEYNGRILAPILLGVDSERVQKMLPFEMWNGRFDVSGDGVVLGIDMAARLMVGVNDELMVYSPMNLVKRDEIYFPERLTVRGIYRTGQAEFDGGYLFVSLPVARDLAGVEIGANSISLRVSDPQALSPFSLQPDPLLARVREVAQARSPIRALTISTWQQLDRLIFNAVATEKNMMTLLLIFISVVAIFCVVNTIIVITVQKTHEIGLLKALGFSTRQLTMTFVCYGWIQCVVGTALGIALAFLVLCNLQSLVEALAHCGVEVFPKAVYGLDALPWRVEALEVAQVAVMVVGFCALASLLPAWRAAAMNPVDALRKE
ncbi:MAG: ABC transporter permease [Lentisphaeraceae bacterium]|nr:ABC transporter permease [Lentisphaeraceae bacterium]